MQICVAGNREEGSGARRLIEAARGPASRGWKENEGDEKRRRRATSMESADSSGGTQRWRWRYLSWGGWQRKKRPGSSVIPRDLALTGKPEIERERDGVEHKRGKTTLLLFDVVSNFVDERKQECVKFAILENLNVTRSAFFRHSCSSNCCQLIF